MILTLTSLDATAALADAMASILSYPYPAILLRGRLGAGKTTFIRFLVEKLPGGELSEVSSPSFNIMNLYPTTPPVAHFDLYRTSGLGIGDDVEEILASPQYLHLIEWADFLPKDLFPEQYLEMEWNVEEDKRILTITPHGSLAEQFAVTLKNLS